MLSMLLIGIGILVLIAILFTAINAVYVKAPPSTAYIISGLRSKPRILVGSGGIKLPFFERMDTLFLGQVSVNITTEQSVPTNDFINVNVDAIAKVSVGSSEEARQLAAKNFLNFAPEEIANSLQDSLEGNMREIIGTLTLQAINTDRDSFAAQVVEKAAQDMRKLGIEIISCNVQNVTDDMGLIVDLGADNTARIKKGAAISKAQAERDIAIAQAEAQKEANDAKVKADLEIAQRQNELSIKRSELKKASDIRQAEADAAYKIQEQEQEKTLQAKSVEAQIEKAKKDAELRAQEVEIKQRELEATVNKQSEAEKYATERNAEADLEKRKREAEAQLYEQQQEAAAKKAVADAQRYAMEQEAAAIKAKGQAEAYAIQQKGEAEAMAMDKKAEAMQKYGRAAMAQMIIQVLPQVAEQVAKPLQSIDKISIIGGSDASVNPIASNVPLVLAKTLQTVKEATGIDLNEIIRAETYEAKTTKNLNINGDAAVQIGKAEADDEKGEPLLNQMELSEAKATDEQKA